MVVLYIAAAVRGTAKDSVGVGKKRSRCRIDDDTVACHIACAERKAAVELFRIVYIFECQRIACHVAAVGFLLDKACCRAEGWPASGMFGVVARCMCIVNRYILPADIGSACR